jgi:hypothetical protein
MKWLARFVALALIIGGGPLLGACASTGALSPTTPLTSRLSTYRTIVFEVSSQVPESAQETIQLESMTVARLREKGIFEKVIAGSAASPDTPADLRLRTRITELNKVGSGARAVLGAFAGQGKIVVAGELIDVKAAQNIGAFTAEGKSSGGTVFAGTTEQAIERAVEQIVEFVVKSK